MCSFKSDSDKLCPSCNLFLEQNCSLLNWLSSQRNTELDRGDRAALTSRIIICTLPRTHPYSRIGPCCSSIPCMFRLRICWCVLCTRYGIWSKHLIYSRKPVYSQQETHRGSFPIRKSTQKYLEGGAGDSSEQVFEFVLATLFHIHQSMRMSFVFQVCMQAYILCLNIVIQCVNRLPEDGFAGVLLKYTGSGVITGRVGVRRLHCLFIYRKINVF